MGQGGKALYVEATPARVNAQRYKGVLPGQELQTVWYGWSEAAVRWGDGALPGKGCQKELKNITHFVGKRSCQRVLSWGVPWLDLHLTKITLVPV